MLCLLGACSKTSNRRLYETPCGAGKLVLALKVVTHPPAPSEVKFSLTLVSDGKSRFVDVLKPRATVWARPGESERFTTLRSGPDNWPIFVSPRHFTAAEFDQIRDRLKAVAGEFDASAAQSRTGVSADYGADVQLSSIRYVDYDSFRRTYTGSNPKVTATIYPDGGLWLIHPGGTVLLGNIVEGGRKLVFGSSLAKLTIAGIADPVGYALAAKDSAGRRIADEFAVEKLTSSQYEAVMINERADRAK
jgi:hypothetical protein